MSNNNPPNPFEELQNQLQDFLRKNQGTGQTGPSQESGFDSSGQEVEEKANPVLENIRRFHLKPREIRDHLNRYVIKQQEAKKVLSVAICDHYNHVRQCMENPELREQEYNKQNIILLGPTGVGKTYLMRHIAKLIGVPFVKGDATKFSETGYVGFDVEDLVRDLVKSADGDVELAQYGIIYIDEIDKIAAPSQPDSGGGMRDVSGRGVQTNLLKLMEETDVNLHSQTDMMGQMQAMMEMQKGEKSKPKSISTRHILFIVSGAFDQLANMIKKRKQSTQIGFTPGDIDSKSSRIDTYSWLHEATTGDFMDYGFEPEFVGRLPVRVACESLNAQDLSRVLTASEGSILKQYESDFKGYDIDLSFTQEAIDEIAAQAEAEQTGARGLMTVLEHALRDFKFELPSTGIRSLEVTNHTLKDPKQSLNQLLVDNQHLQEGILEKDLQRFLEYFHEEYGYELEFSDEARKKLIEKSHEQDITIHALCTQKFADFQHGLGIINRNTGQQRFTIDAEVIEAPDKTLSGWVVESFRQLESEEETDASSSSAASKGASDSPTPKKDDEQA